MNLALFKYGMTPEQFEAKYKNADGSPMTIEDFEKTTDPVEYAFGEEKKPAGAPILTSAYRDYLSVFEVSREGRNQMGMDYLKRRVTSGQGKISKDTGESLRGVIDVEKLGPDEVLRQLVQSRLSEDALAIAPEKFRQARASYSLGGFWGPSVAAEQIGNLLLKGFKDGIYDHSNNLNTEIQRDLIRLPAVMSSYAMNDSPEPDGEGPDFSQGEETNTSDDGAAPTAPEYNFEDSQKRRQKLLEEFAMLQASPNTLLQQKALLKAILQIDEEDSAARVAKIKSTPGLRTLSFPTLGENLAQPDSPAETPAAQPDSPAETPAAQPDSPAEIPAGYRSLAEIPAGMEPGEEDATATPEAPAAPAAPAAPQAQTPNAPVKTPTAEETAAAVAANAQGKAGPTSVNDAEFQKALEQRRKQMELELQMQQKATDDAAALQMRNYAQKAQIDQMSAMRSRQAEVDLENVNKGFHVPEVNKMHPSLTPAGVYYRGFLMPSNFNPQSAEQLEAERRRRQGPLPTKQGEWQGHLHEPADENNPVHAGTIEKPASFKSGMPSSIPVRTRLGAPLTQEDLDWIRAPIRRPMSPAKLQFGTAVGATGLQNVPRNANASLIPGFNPFKNQRLA